MTDSFRTRLLRGDRLIGTIVSLDSPEIVEILCASGLDWLFLDAEHAPLTPSAMQRLIQAAGDTPCVIRLADHDDTTIKKALDIGAAGIIVPQVNDAAQAAAIVRRAKFPPRGTRGIGIARANRYGLDVPGYLARADEHTAVIVQAEHVDAVEHIDDIVAVEGVDAVFVGPYDLSASLGKTGRLTDPEVATAIDRVTAACRDSGMRLGIFGIAPDTVAARAAEGYTLLVSGLDALMVGQAAQALVAVLREA